MWRLVLVCMSMLLSGIPSHAQSVIRLARIADIPDQYVGGEILRAVYGRLNITIEFEDVPGKRALALSSTGELDGEVHRIANLARDYPTLVQISPPINYIEPLVFTTALRFDVQRWNSIRKYSIGIVRGVGSSEAGTRGMDRVTAAASLENMIRMLDAGRFDRRDATSRRFNRGSRPRSGRSSCRPTSTRCCSGPVRWSRRVTCSPRSIVAMPLPVRRRWR